MSYARWLVWVLLLSGGTLHGQVPGSTALHLRHRVYMGWGYNRAQYSLSNIHFTGPGYDFILHGVGAIDFPTPVSAAVYLDPKDLSLPQYNYRVGWFYNDRWSFSLGTDHMKYVLAPDQSVRITGTISQERSQRYAGTEEHTVALTPDFLMYEHTDGLNLLSVDVDHFDPLLRSANGKRGLFLTEGLFAGPVIPRSDVRLFGVGLNNTFHLAGYGAGAQLGLFGIIADRFFGRLAVKGGFIDLPSVLTTGTKEDRASQRFWFVQEYATVGVLIGK
jgi:hypothetical protein